MLRFRLIYARFSPGHIFVFVSGSDASVEGCESNTLPNSLGSLRVASVFDAALFEEYAELALRFRPFAGVFGPHLIGLVELVFTDLQSLASEAPVGQEVPEHVHLRAIPGRGFPYFRRRLEAFALPIDAPARNPRQDPGQLVAELLGELPVSLRRRDGHRPRYESDAPPNGVVGATDL